MLLHNLSYHLSSHGNHLFIYFDFGIVVTSTHALDCGTEHYSVFVTNQMSRCRHGSVESNALVIKISNLVEFPITMHLLRKGNHSRISNSILIVALTLSQDVSVTLRDCDSHRSLTGPELLKRLGRPLRILQGISTCSVDRSAFKAAYRKHLYHYRFDFENCCEKKVG